VAAIVLIASAFAAAGAVRAEDPEELPAAACTDTVPAIYGRVSPAVVSIAAMSTKPYDVQNRVDRVMGSGFMVDPAGLILTNSHVVYGRQAIKVTLDDGTTLPGQLVGADPLFDIALVRVAASGGAPFAVARLGDSDRSVAGQDVLAIGNPFGLEQTLTRGIISAVNRQLPGVPPSLNEPMIQTDAPINPGSSGGPLINRCGEVIGITTSILTDAQNIGFAIPINLVKSVMPSLTEHGRVVRPWLGVQGELVTQALKDLLRIPLVDGFLVEGVDPGSPADKLGIVGGKMEIVIDGQPVLLGGDIVTHIDGAPVDGVDRLSTALAAFSVGKTIHVTIFRNSDVVELDCALTERPLLPLDVPETRTIAPMGALPRAPRPHAHSGAPSAF
jgi:S1-C subfamily serine protease